MIRYVTAFLLLMFWQVAWAQTPTPKPAPTVVIPMDSPSPYLAPGASATPNLEAVEPSFATPQGSLESFMTEMAQAGPLRPDLYVQARRHLNLADIPAVMRDEQGLSLCQQLYAILLTDGRSPRTLKLNPQSQTVTIYRQPSGDEISMERLEDGRWVVDQTSVKLIPKMYLVLGRQGKITLWRLDALDFELLGINGNIWLCLLLLPLLSYGVGRLATLVLGAALVRLLPKHIGHEILHEKRALRPLGWLFASLIFWIGISALDLPSWILLVLTIAVKIVATGAAILTAFRASDYGARYAARLTSRTVTKFDDMLIPLARRTFKTVVGILGLLFLAQNLDIEVWSLFAGFSIFGAMVALAGQDMVKNFFGSITVLMDQPFTVGDWIVVDGVEGVVEDVGFRSTRIRTFYDSLVTLPNSKLITASVDNYGARNYRRYTKKLPILWSTSPEKLEAFCEGIRELVRSHPYTRKDSYQIWVNDVSDYAIEILIYVFWAAPDWNTELRERHRFLVDMHRLASDLGIEFALPTQKLFLNQSEDPSENIEDTFDLKSFEAVQKQGRDATKALLSRSLPKDKPPPEVIG